MAGQLLTVEEFKKNKMKEIKYPKETTYFICRNEKNIITAYGSVSIYNVLATSQPILDTFVDESEWIAILKNENIIIENYD